MFSVTAIL